MTRRRAARTRLPRSPKPGSVLERLEADEAHAVLHHLLTPHPDLRTEAEQAARSLLSQVSFESVADDVVNMLVLVHARPTANAQPRPPLEESYRRHEGLIAELAPRARATGLPVAWHALWRLPPAMTWSEPGGKPWMRYPAVSFVAAARPWRQAERHGCA